MAFGMLCNKRANSSQGNHFKLRSKTLARYSCVVLDHTVLSSIDGERRQEGEHGYGYIASGTCTTGSQDRVNMNNNNDPGSFFHRGHGRLPVLRVIPIMRDVLVQPGSKLHVWFGPEYNLK
jgi:hypothetical protein